MASTEPLRMRVPTLHPRVVYASKTIWDGFLEVPVVCVTDTENFDFEYSPNADGLKPGIPCDGFLLGQETFDPKVEDPLSTIFKRITQEKAYHSPKLDSHGRHVEDPPGFELHSTLNGFRNWLGVHFPDRLVSKPKFTWEITIDVDRPWKHAHKPWWVTLGSIVKSAGSRDWSGLRERFQQQDPFDTLSRVREICPPTKTTVFFLVDGDHALDSRYDLKMKPYQDYVKRWKEAGYRIGLHPSYRSSDEMPLIDQEKALLEAVVGSVKTSRQHYLRYRLPETFRRLESLGIMEDYSLCGHEDLGGRTGIAMPYPWYDLQQERETNLKMVPAVAMDRTLQQYLGSNPQSAFGKTAACIDYLRQTGGHFVLILHNETFSESGEWKGWTRWVDSTIQYLSGHGV